MADAALAGSNDLRLLAAEGARLAIAFDYHDALMPFYAASEEYDLPDIFTKEDVDGEILQYANDLLGRDRHAV